MREKRFDTQPGAQRFSSIPRSVRFTLVGILGSALNLAILALLVEGMQSPAIPASALATEISIVHNFLFHRHWTFSSTATSLPFFSGLARYNLSSLATASINLLIVLMLTRTGCWYLCAQSLGIVAAWFANYHLSSRLVFPDVP